jgi:hypothetical protein
MDVPLPSRIKFGAGDGMDRAHVYPHAFCEDKTSDGGKRLLFGPTNSHAALMSKLQECVPEPFRLLYVLVVPRSETLEPARYEAPHQLSRAEVLDFLLEFTEYLEFDGRHHLWVANPDHGTIVYDRHNVLYAYGPLACFAKVAKTHGLRESEFEIPTLHWHAYHSEYDAMQDRLLGKWEWIVKPLRASDEG